jgi:endonuclease YncB( thermonuclease family)
MRTHGPAIRHGKHQPKRKLSLVLALIVLALLFSAGLCWYCFAPIPVAKQTVFLVRTSDGDTVVVRTWNGRQLSVRLYGVDTPELGTAAAFRAALFSAERLERAQRIELEPEGHTTRAGSHGMAHDKYGRVLGWVWYEDAQGKMRLLNEELLLAHLAVLYHKTPQGIYGERLWRAAR